MTDPFLIAAARLRGERPARPGHRPPVELNDEEGSLLEVAAILRDVGALPGRFPPADLRELEPVLASAYPPGTFA